MEKSPNMKEEIYKIVKYQTKLAESKTREQQDLYKYKLTQHITNLTNSGIKKEAIQQFMKGGAEGEENTILNIQKLLEQQKLDTIAALDNIEKNSKSGQSDLEDEKKAIVDMTSDAVDKYKTVVDSYKENVVNSYKNMGEIQDKAENLGSIATLTGNLEDLKTKLDNLLANVRDPSQLANELSDAVKEEVKSRESKKKPEESQQGGKIRSK
jgi:hypothetical protein